MRSILTALLLLFKTELVLWENIMNDIDFEQCYKRFSKTLKIARKVSDEQLINAIHKLEYTAEVVR